VKTVVDQKGKVLYFSRQPIPNSRSDQFKSGIKQIGIYVFRKKFLLEFSSWKECPLEKAEGVDMMRILEYGYPIHTYEAKDMISVDTPRELKEMESVLLQDSLYQQIFQNVS
ncbi:MAG: 3-deoxy-manno-octulosonate cytidylyltransferase, partial [Candidatus Omnitrophica bacterium]|nr:3-deoxy-manno-octulosonate cytidylyltransferase [Candidatus Omnitrophota bacterium]